MNQNPSDMTEAFLALASDDRRQRCLETITAAGDDWAALQQAFLAMIDAYVEVELARLLEDHLDSHEAGGQWRIAFAHQALRSDERIGLRMAELMAARKQWAGSHFFHGFPDCAEVHHQIETFLYFQIPLLYSGGPGSALALESIEDVAHHAGNWEAAVPDWYSWKDHGFLSTWLGTKEVRNYPPHDYQEANHFRFVDVVVAAYLGTGNARYLGLACDYADRWCRHIAALAEGGKSIPCSILPENVRAGEMARGGKHGDGDKNYKVFYTTAAVNTAYDVASCLLDVYRLTGREHYLVAYRQLTDQFFEHSQDGRPAFRLSQEQWGEHSQKPKTTAGGFFGPAQPCVFLSRLALKHDLVTGGNHYRSWILDWAGAIDERANQRDQVMPELMVAAHFYDGNPAWLARGYAMALRAAAAVEDDAGFHQCNSTARMGSKFLMELLYQPLLGAFEWGARGNIPIRRLTHCGASGWTGLPAGVSFRTWRIDASTDGFEAVNRSSEMADWRVSPVAGPEALRLETPSADSADGRILLPARGTLRGKIFWKSSPNRWLAQPVLPTR